MKLWSQLKESMLRHLTQTVSENNAEMTYEELVAFSESFAVRLRGESSCAILCSSEMATAMALLSCFAADVTAVPLSLRYGKQHCKKILDLVSPTALITDLDGKLQVMCVSDAAYVPPDVRPALIMCTSGTTGTPKGVMLTEENLLINVGDICDYLKIESNDSILISRPLYHCAVLSGEFLVSLQKGVKIRFYSGPFNPRILFDQINRYQITAFCSTPTVFRMMTRFARTDDGVSLRTICISGECLDATTGKQIAASFPTADIYHVYGLTEASPRVSFLPPELFATHCEYVGIPLHSVNLRILRSDGSCAKRGEVGHLYVKGGNVMRGYYRDASLTAKVLKRGWLCTGDIAVMNKEGLLRILGRSDDLIIRSGMNIYPQEIERALKADSAVKEVLAYKIEDHLMGARIGLKLSGDFKSVDEAKELCRRILPDYQMPSVIEVLDELPKNGSGKLVHCNKP